MTILDRALGWFGLQIAGRAVPQPEPEVKPTMTKAEYLRKRGLKDVPLPVAGITALVRKPRTMDLFRTGLFPLKLTPMELEKVDPDEREQLLKEADRAAVKMICECTVEPKIVNRTARPDETRIDALDDEDFHALYNGILDLIEQQPPEPPQEPHSSFEYHMRELSRCSFLRRVLFREAREPGQRRPQFLGPKRSRDQGQQQTCLYRKARGTLL